MVLLRPKALFRSPMMVELAPIRLFCFPLTLLLYPWSWLPDPSTTLAPFLLAGLEGALLKKLSMLKRLSREDVCCLACLNVDCMLEKS